MHGNRPDHLSPGSRKAQAAEGMGQGVGSSPRRLRACRGPGGRPGLVITVGMIRKIFKNVCERQRDREGESFHLQVHGSDAGNGWGGQSQEPGALPSSPLGVTGTQVLDHHHCLPGCPVTGSWSEEQSWDSNSGTLIQGKDL